MYVVQFCLIFRTDSNSCMLRKLLEIIRLVLGKDNELLIIYVKMYS